MRKDTRIGLFVYIGVLCFLALALVFLIWQHTPFFDMRHVLLVIVILLTVAVLFAVAVMTPPDTETRLGLGGC